jgi:serine/threonine protein kinase
MTEPTKPLTNPGLDSVGALRLEQRNRWRRGENVRVEAYVDRYPMLSSDAEALLDLIYNEVVLRQECGETPTEQEYCERFPALRSQLRKMFELHQALFADNLEQASAPGVTLARPPALSTSCGRDQSSTPNASAPAQGQADPLVGKRLGQYELAEKLGQGGMGTVYKARHTLLKRTVAVKLLRAELVRDVQAVQRFRLEMEAVGRLKHPNLIEASDAGEHDGVHFLVMEYLEGADLRELILHHGALPAVDACELIRQAALGLHHAHEHGLVHRDVKPSNLLLTTSGQVKVLDLGLVRLLDAQRNGQDLTSSGQCLGTLDYLAPEQARDSRHVDRRTDVYSLGCALYHLLVGRPPFAGSQHETPVQKLWAHANSRPRAPSTLRAGVPADVDILIEAMLAKSPSERPASAAEIARRLDPHAKGSSLSTLCRQDGPSVRPISETVTPSVVAQGTVAQQPSQPQPDVRPYAFHATRRKWLKRSLIGALCLLLGLAAWIGATTNWSPAGHPPELVELEFFVERPVAGQEPAIDHRLLVRQGLERDAASIDPLKPADHLKLIGRFREPTNWYLLWIDTNGVAGVVSASGEKSADFSYPAGRAFQHVDPKDPPGVHVLILLASERELDPVQDELVAALRDVGPPPRQMPPRWAIELRGPGELVTSARPIATLYLRDIKKRLPASLHPIQAVFFGTTE